MERLQSLLEQIAALPLPRARILAEEVVRELLQFYGRGLERIVDISRDEPVMPRFCADTVVAGLLSLHGLHPIPIADRVQQALDRVRPYMGTHGGDVQVVSIRDGVVTLRLEGSCDGCPSSAMTMKLAVERAILEAVPEIDCIELEGQSPAPVLAGDPTWLPLHLDARQVQEANVGGVSLTVCRLGDGLFAFLDGCPDCQRQLHTACIKQAVLVCQCGQRFDIRKAGRSLQGGPSLTALPLRQQGDDTLVAVLTERIAS